MKRMIVAYDTARGIGAEQDLLWLRDLPADLRHFKQLTMGGSMIMGRTTFDSIGRALPGRQSIVLSSQPGDTPGVAYVSSLDEAYAAAQSDIWIIGGESVYRQALADVDEIYATEVQATFDAADRFFPPLDDTWVEHSREHHDADDANKYAYDFVVYRRSNV